MLSSAVRLVKEVIEIGETTTIATLSPNAPLSPLTPTSLTAKKKSNANSHQIAKAKPANILKPVELRR